jgi:hypothetical protein
MDIICAAYLMSFDPASPLQNLPTEEDDGEDEYGQTVDTNVVSMYDLVPKAPG